MTREVFDRLCDLIRSIRPRIAAAWVAPDAFVSLWLRWADTFAAGLYVGRMAERILEHGWGDPARSYDQERFLLGRAATLAVEATREAMHGDPHRAMGKLAEAREVADRADAVRAARWRSVPRSSQPSVPRRGSG
jgi:hypothetical protein